MHLFHILWSIFYVSRRGFHHRLLITGKENVPKGNPFIIATNHPNAFIDAIWVALSARRDVYFMARGDVFKGSVAKFFLKQCHVLPIFRKKDTDEEQLEKNMSSFSNVYKLLNKNNAILIFPEGTSIPEKKLRPFKKGISRLAFGAVQNLTKGKELYILPVGINYHEQFKFGGDLVININKAIRVNDYLNAYQQNPAKTSNQLTQDIEVSCASAVLTIDHHDLEKFCVNLEDFYGEELCYRNQINSRNLAAVYKMRLGLARVVNEAARKNDVEAIDLNSDLQEFINQLNEAGIEPTQLSFENSKKHGLLFYYLILELGFIPFLYGIITNGIPVYFAKKIAIKTVTDPAFYTSIIICVGDFLLIINYIIFGNIIANIPIPGMYQLLLGALIIPAGFWANYYSNIYSKFKKFRALNNLIKTKPTLLRSFEKSELELHTRIEDFLKKYHLKVN